VCAAKGGGACCGWWWGAQDKQQSWVKGSERESNSPNFKRIYIKREEKKDWSFY